MESVLFSIQPKPCEYIAQGIKEWEFRTRPPKIETPYKGYIYCTKKNGEFGNLFFYEDNKGVVVENGKHYSMFLSGTVIGEFICDRTVEVVRNGFVNPFAINSRVLEKGHLSNSEFLSYTDHYRKDLYALHISQLKIYGEPKVIADFKRPHDRANRSFPVIRKAPQSWCFAEPL